MRTGSTPQAIPLDLTALRARLSDLEHSAPKSASVETGWAELDEVLPHGGLPGNSVHEWVGLEPLTTSDERPARRWTPPLGVLLHVVRRAMVVAERIPAPLSICWIGRRVWPTVQALTLHSTPASDLLSRSLFIDAPDARARLWAADLASRCASVLVIADGSGLDMAATRRLQLAAEAGGWMVHLARPPWEAKELSAAATRWAVGRELAPDAPRFRLHLLRCKGMRSMLAQDRTFTLQRESGGGLVLVSPPAADRSRAAKIAG